MNEKPDKAQRERIAILGGGTWGCTLAVLLDRRAHEVRIWDFDPKVVESLLETRVPAKLPHLELPETVAISNDLAEVADGATVIVLVVPSVGMRTTAKALREARPDDGTLLYVICTKGLDKNTYQTMSQVVLEVLGESVRERLGVLSGPSHAEEVARSAPTTVTAAAYKPETARRIQATFFNPTFRVYTHDDILGVEIGAAVKNVIAIAAGICDGLGMGDNAKAALITRGLAEMMRLGRKMGVRDQTLAGLAGMGDLITTCMSPYGRNRAVGMQIGRGRKLKDILAGMEQVAEGVRTTKSVHTLARRRGIEMPITEQCYRVLFRGKSPARAVQDLMRRAAKEEGG